MPDPTIRQRAGALDAPLSFRAAALAPATADPAMRTVRATISSGAAVRARDIQGPYLEVLALDGIDPASVVGVPVLDSHRRDTITSKLGTAVAAGRDAAGLWADLQLSQDAVWQQVQAGELRSVSVAWYALAWTDSRAPDGTRIRTATDWRIVEISFVLFGADPAAHVRADMQDNSAPKPTDQAHPETPAADPPAASPPAPPPALPPPADPPPAAPPPQTRAAPPLADRAAVNGQIRSLARTAGLDQAWVDGQIDAGASVEQARAAAFAALEQRGAVHTGATPPVVIRDHNDPLALRSAMSDAIAARWAPQHCKVEGRAREFMATSLLAMAATLMGCRGGPRVDLQNKVALVDTLLSRAAAHSTSDFPLLLQDSANKMMLPAYQAAAPTYRGFAAQRGFNDFKPHHFLHAGDFPRLRDLAEAGVVQYGTVSESDAPVTPKEYAAGLEIGRRVLINDDLRQFAEFSTSVGIRVAADENAIVFLLLAANAGCGPTLTDTHPVFDAAHGNKAAAGTALDVTNFGAAVAALRAQQSLDGIPLNIAPAVLVVGPLLELSARQLLAPTLATKAGDFNPWAGIAQLLIDANITDKRWYLFASPGLYPVLVFGYVAGQSGPAVRTEIDFDSRALKVAVGLDFGAGAVDFRGGYFNPGT